jgi:hypothetical protein
MRGGAVKKLRDIWFAFTGIETCNGFAFASTVRHLVDHCDMQPVISSVRCLQRYPPNLSPQDRLHRLPFWNDPDPFPLLAHLSFRRQR